MKQSVFLALALLTPAALLFSAETIQNDKTSASKAIGYPTKQINVTTWDHLRYTMRTESITVGTSQKRVLALLGTPKWEYEGKLAIYDNCSPDQEIASRCKDLIINYENGKVAGLVFGNQGMSTHLALKAQKTQDKGEPTEIIPALALPDKPNN